MATSESKNKLECSICLSAFRDPKLLPCYHTFCLECLHEYVTKNAHHGKFECPLCRVETVIPVGGINAFQSNFYIQAGEVSKTDVDCDVCGTGHISTHYCIDCEEHFCEKCSNAHMKMKVSREHKILVVTEPDGELNGARKIHKKVYCPCHIREEIKMTCKDCNCLLCVVCKLTEHENHNTSSIDKEATERRGLLSKEIADTKELVDRLKKDITQADKYLEKINLDHKKCIDDIEKCVKSFTSNIHENAEKMMKELGESRNSSTDYYKQQQKRLQNKITETEGIINHAQYVVDFGDDIQVLDAELQSKVKSLKSTEYRTLKDYKPQVFEAGIPRIKPNLIGRIFKMKNVTELGEITSLPCHTRNTNTISIVGDRLFAAFSNHSKLYYHNTTTSKALEFLELHGSNNRCLGLICVNHYLYYTSKKDRTIYKYDFIEKECTKLQTFNEYPHGLAVLSTGKIIITCLSNSPETLKVNNDQGYVVFINLPDQDMRTWKGKETPGPRCVAVNETEDIVCLGYPAARRVTLNTLDGDILSEYIGEGCQGSPERFFPVSVCFDSEDCVIVADYTNNAVIRISKCCSYIQCLIKKKAPLCVTYADKNMLYVGYENEFISRYQLEDSE